MDENSIYQSSIMTQTIYQLQYCCWLLIMSLYKDADSACMHYYLCNVNNQLYTTNLFVFLAIKVTIYTNSIVTHKSLITQPPSSRKTNENQHYIQDTGQCQKLQNCPVSVREGRGVGGISLVGEYFRDNNNLINT